GRKPALPCLTVATTDGSLRLGGLTPRQRSNKRGRDLISSRDNCRTLIRNTGVQSAKSQTKYANCLSRSFRRVKRGSTQTLIPALPGGIRLAIDLSIDWRVLAYTSGFSLLVGVFFGLVPALQISRPDVIATLKEGAQGFAGGYAQSRLRNGLIVAQVALALVL